MTPVVQTSSGRPTRAGDLGSKGGTSAVQIPHLFNWFYSDAHLLILENFEDSVTQASSKPTVPFTIYLKLLMSFFLVRDMNLKEF